jgi:hydrogenase maturation protease
MGAEKPARAAVFGLGSVLMGDDALGPYFARTFDAAWELPDTVSIEDLGTPGPELCNYLSGLDALIVIDAIRAPGEPGELRFYEKDELLRHDLSAGRTAHDPSLHSALIAARLTGDAPDQILLVGVIPAKVELNAGLSEPVAQSMPRIERAVVEQLEAWGIEPRRRRPARQPDLWWLD